MKNFKILFSFVLLFTVLQSNAQTFSDGLSIVTKADRIDTLSSNPMNARGYDSVISYEGKSIGYVNPRWSVVDAAGKVIIPEGKEVIRRIGDVFKIYKSGQHILIDRTGKIIHEYEIFAEMDDCDFYRVFKNGKYGVVDANGKEIIPCLYEIPCQYYSIEDGSFFRVSKNSRKWGLIDSAGKITIPCEYEYLYYSENGVFRAIKNDYYGCIDKNNQVIFDFKYAYINSFANGVAEAFECENFVQVRNRLMVKLYERRGYELLRMSNGQMAMGKNPKYSELRIENLISN